MNRTERAELAAETVRIVDSGFYMLPGESTISLADARDECCGKTRLYQPEDLLQLVSEIRAKPIAEKQASFELVNETTLAGISRLRRIAGDEPIAALNFASAKNPGGGFLGGSQAQEESLARSSALYASLMCAWTYYEQHRAMSSPFYSDAMILSPACPIFRDDSGALLSELEIASFISSAAPNAGRIRQDLPDEVDQIPAILRQRAECVLAVAVATGHKNIVLGAWGCGVFQNDPGMVASTFKRLLVDKGWSARFDRVRFSVLDTSPSLNIFRAFSETLGL